MTLTRNDYAVHKRKGSYPKSKFYEKTGLTSNEDIDLRFFTTNWKYAFAVTEK